MNEITFNGKSCYKDFGAILNYFKPQPPQPKIIKDDVPFMNGSYDFSTVGTNGEMVYSERKIQVSLQFLTKNKGALYTKYSQILSWLMDSGKQQLIYTGDPDVYYMARVENVPSWDVFFMSGTLVIEFTAEPFKKGVDEEGNNQLWDPFNFETDYMQTSGFDITTSGTVTVYNPGRIVIPTVVVNANMSCTLNGYTASFSTSKSVDYAFKLKPGTNTITVTGTGHIEFVFRKTLL